MIATTIDMGRAFTDNGGGGGVRRSRIGVVLELAKTAGPVVTARSVACLGNRPQGTGDSKSNTKGQQQEPLLALGYWLKKSKPKLTTKDTKERQATGKAITKSKNLTITSPE